MSADPQIVETAINKILDNAFTIADKEICSKIPSMIQKRSEKIIGQIIKDLGKEAKMLKIEMAKKFNQDIKNDLRQTIATVGVTYNDTIDALIKLNVPIKTAVTPIVGIPAVGGRKRNSNRKRANRTKKIRVTRHKK